MTKQSISTDYESSDSLLKRPDIVAMKKEMIREAEEKYGIVFPVSRRKELDDCFTIFDSFILFWFNTSAKTTRVLRRELPQ